MDIDIDILSGTSYTGHHGRMTHRLLLHMELMQVYVLCLLIYLIGLESCHGSVYTGENVKFQIEFSSGNKSVCLKGTFDSYLARQ